MKAQKNKRPGQLSILCLAGALGLAGCFNQSRTFTECQTKDQNSKQVSYSHKLAFIVGNGFTSNQPGQMVEELSNHYHFPFQAVPSFPGNYKSLISFARETKQHGFKLAAAGYSSGPDGIVRALNELADEGICADYVFFVSPTKGSALKNSKNIPGNPKIYVYFPKNKGFMAWADGSHSAWDQNKDSRVVAVKIIDGSHTTCLAKGLNTDLGHDLANLLQEETAQALGYIHSR